MLPATETLTLVSRRDYGAEVQAPTAILRFALPRATLWQRLTRTGFARFEAGDLLGILPEGSAVPRLYSLASGKARRFRRDRGQEASPAALRSGQLTALEPGDTVTAFLRRNPGFHAGRGRAPLILIGAGTGIGPLAGFVRDNAGQRPIHLFFGMRHPGSDFLYGEELPDWQAEGRLTRLVTAVSRGAQPTLRAGRAARRTRPRSRGWSARAPASWSAAGATWRPAWPRRWPTILAPVGLTPATLKAEGRYVEDVY